MITEARRQAGWKILRSIPFLGPVRVAQILAIMATPWRFRTKRQAWPYVGLAVVTRSSADQELAEGKVLRRERDPLTYAATDARLVEVFERSILSGGGIGRALEHRLEQRMMVAVQSSP